MPVYDDDEKPGGYGELQQAVIAVRYDKGDNIEGIILYEQGEYIKRACENRTTYDICDMIFDAHPHYDPNLQSGQEVKCPKTIGTTVWIWEGYIEDGSDYYTYSWRLATEAEWALMMMGESPFDDEEEEIQTPLPKQRYGERHEL